MRYIAILGLLFAVTIVIVALYQNRLPQLVAALAGSAKS